MNTYPVHRLVRFAIHVCLLVLGVTGLSMFNRPTHLFGVSKRSQKGEENNKTPARRKVIIGYIRKSYTNEEEGIDELRQEKNIREMVEGMGCVLELYRDTDGHKSGTQVENRTGWQQSENRLFDADVLGLCVNELSRAHRKGWRISQLLDELSSRQQCLIIARDRRILDLESREGKMVAQFMAMADEWYAADVAERARDSINRRRADGVTVAQPVQACERDEQGFLRLRTDGVWLLSSGDIVPGEVHLPPTLDAIWRGYADSVRFVLEVYSTNTAGASNLSRALRRNGYFLRTDHGHPKLSREDDVRRIIAAWPQYAGLVVIGRGKDRPKGLIPLNWQDTGRAVFPMPLLRRVAQVENDRRLSRSTGSVSRAYPYALRGLLHCEKCERDAEAKNNPALRTKINGTDKNGRLSYRHAEGALCNGHTRSVKSSTIESQIVALLQKFQLKAPVADALKSLTPLLAEADIAQTEMREAMRRASLYRVKQRVRVLEQKYDDGEIDHTAYHAKKAELADKSHALQARRRTSEPQKLDIERFVELTINPGVMWNNASIEDRQMLLSLLFEGVWYDLDEQAITRYTLQPWARMYMEVRAT